MTLLFRIIELVTKLAILFFIVALERVVGFPVVFLTISVSYMLLARTFSKYVHFVIAAFLLAIFYQLSFTLTLFILALMYFGFIFGSKAIESNFQRFMGLLILSVLVVAFVSEININFWIMMQLIFSLLIAALFLLKFLFVKYGFIGKRLTNT